MCFDKVFHDSFNSKNRFPEPASSFMLLYHLFGICMNYKCLPIYVSLTSFKSINEGHCSFIFVSCLVWASLCAVRRWFSWTRNTLIGHLPLLDLCIWEYCFPIWIVVALHDSLAPASFFLLFGHILWQRPVISNLYILTRRFCQKMSVHTDPI